MWVGCDGVGEEIFFWDGVTTTQLTDTGLNRHPDISGSNVVWYGFDGVSYEIFLWDGVTTTQLTSNSSFVRDPVVSGSNVVWRGYDGDDEIYMTTFYVGCGDGVIMNPEECDDNGTAPGDGCDTSCKIESGWICEGEPSVCTQLPLPVPSISFGGLALLAGLVPGVVAWARRCS